MKEVENMPQKLSAITYIKNNKRRVAVLIGSLSLCVVLFYVSQFVLASTTETFGSILVENTEKIQYIQLPGYAFGLDFEALGEEKFSYQYQQKHLELKEELKKVRGVKQVYFSQVNYIEILGAVGQYYLELPMVPEENVDELIEHFNATLVEGNLPKQDNEIVLDEKSMKNGGYKIGDALRDYPKTKIVGILNCDYYFGCGVISAKNATNERIIVLSDGSVSDVTKLLYDMGYEFDEEDAYIMDKKEGKKDLKKDIIDAISTSTNIIYLGIIFILSISLLVVYITYLRDRRNEWCLYCSIGYARKCIYFAVMRELLFTFLASVLIGGVLSAILVFILDYGMLRLLGLMCQYFYPENIFKILVVFALILGILQVPIRFELYKIKTIDAIDDDLN